MSWKFWQKKEAAPAAQEPMEWPTDSYAAVRMLAALFIGRDLPPFSQWRAADAQLAPNIQPLAEFGTKGFQLALWFWLFRQTHGDIAARMARDAYCLFLDSAGEGEMGQQTEALLAIIDTTRSSFEDMPEDKRQFTSNGQTVDLPFHWYLAIAFLTQVSDSPYRGVDGAELGDTDTNVALCLAHGAEQANKFWEPMLAHIGPFNPASFPAWKWSVHPGSFERHLQRRYDNPLFPAERRTVTAGDVYYARLKDAQAIQDVRRGLSEVFEELKKGDLPIDWHPYLNGIREQLDELYDRLQEAGGDSGLEKSWRGMREHIIDTWRAAVGNNEESLETLSRAEAMTQQGRDEMALWLHQVAAPTKSIPPEEVTCSLLTESIEDIRKAVARLGHDGEAMTGVRKEALVCVMKALAEGHQVPQHREKLAVLGVAI